MQRQSTTACRYSPSKSSVSRYTENYFKPDRVANIEKEYQLKGYELMNSNEN